MKNSVIFLGAGRPSRGVNHSVLGKDHNRKPILEWILDAFLNSKSNFIFVGGYQIDKIYKKYSEIEIYVNHRWNNTSSVASLLCVPLTINNNYFVTYTDIVFRPNLISKMNATDGDMVVAIDTKWTSRYERRTEKDISMAECVVHGKGGLIKSGLRKEIYDATAEFVGVMLLRKEAVNVCLKSKGLGLAHTDKMCIPDLIDFAIKNKLKVSFVDVQGDWAELNAPQDLARFVFGSKGETLERLSRLTKTCYIGNIKNISVKEWETNSTKIIKEIQTTFPNELLAIRSSSLDEDSWTSSKAGKYKSILNVKSSDTKHLNVAIEQVVNSYNDSNIKNQVLIHKIVKNILLSGVVFTRSLTTGAPYYIINYDDTSEKADSVTSGLGNNLKIAVVHRSQKKVSIDTNTLLNKLLITLNELEKLAGHDSLDIEFIISKAGQVHVLQVRPIAVDHTKWNSSDKNIKIALKKSITKFENEQKPSSFILGNKTFFGLMPDWNPAEIIGTLPQNLSSSLYRRLITDDIWAQQRAEVGYRDVRPHKLMHMFMGHPYIDVRASFNSFIPASIDTSLANKMIMHYLELLKENPHYHDKIEFKIAVTCMTPDIKTKMKNFVNSGFKKSEIISIEEGLTKVTMNIFNGVETHLSRIKLLSDRFNKIRKTQNSSLARALVLLADCKIYGTLPFSHLARAGFVAISLLESFVEESIITQEELQLFMQSLDTITSNFLLDGLAVKEGKTDRKTFIDKYGHLRPGTYEITSPTYASDEEHFLKPKIDKNLIAELKINRPWSEKSRINICKFMSSINLENNFSKIDKFLRRSIEGREMAKFLFSKNLSLALEDIASFGKEINITRKELSHISIEDIEKIQLGFINLDKKEWLKKRSIEGAEEFQIGTSSEMPSIIFDKNDFCSFERMANIPNFVTLKSITAMVLEISDDNNQKNLSKKIIVMERADPGYDWIFTKDISGLITCYGGANSHMAIRSAELGIPAAIGVGEILFDKLTRAKSIILDCAGKRIDILI